MLVMTGHAKKLSDLGIVIPNRLGINRVLQSLPPSYKNFVMNYNMQNMNKEFPELFGMLKAAEIEIKKEHQVLMVNKTTSFKKQGKSKGKFKKGGKKAATPPVKPKSGPKPDAECYYCKEKGHWKRNCSKYLADLKSGLVKKKKEGSGSRGTRRRPRQNRSSDEFAQNAPRKSTTIRRKNKAPRENYKSMDIATYAAIRMKNWYEDVARDDEIEDKRFWCLEQEFIYKDIYEPMRKVRPMQAINVDDLAANDHFEDAIWVTGRMGLQDLMKIQCDYSPELIKQFFATLAFKKDAERTMEWMSGSTHCEATLRRFASILGLPAEGGLRLHGPQKTDKNVLFDLYDSSGAVGSTKGLLPIYSQVLRFLRATIAPSGGNNDALRGALVGLMHLSFKCARDGNEDQDFSLDIMDFIFHEIHDAMVSRTTMPSTTLWLWMKT
ncbi:hypothetical protein QYE76_055205 [Lolium multiflorum]|uniref:CCHC-type domain-containing protein n=1 Tax=Lolium multiflorum TaxID=4521 RepID=A0AAD8WM28_LOLMU|nr:hypothetical protein QYE76_055205 [Lolium multiflorum]